MVCLAVFFLPVLRVASHGLADGGRSSGWIQPPSPPGVYGADEDYELEGAVYQGYFSRPLAKIMPKGGVLVAHQWMGLGDYEKARADELAAMGYVAFALDVYGKGVRCNDTDCAGKEMNKVLSNITELRKRVSAGTDQLLKHFGNKDRLVAMGYCFGGGIVLDIARHPEEGASSGVSYKAVSSIHGVLDAWNNETAGLGEVTARIQVHHADLDFQGEAPLLALEAELRIGTNGTAGLWETTKYAKCEHGWTEVGTEVYNARAAVQAHKSTFEFFEMSLGLEDPEADAFPIDPICRHRLAESTVL